MTTALAFIALIIMVALIFDVANGWHDAANSIATVVSTRVLSPGVAVAWAAFFNFVAFALFGTRVAQTIAGDLVEHRANRRAVAALGSALRAHRRNRVGRHHMVLRASDQLFACARRRLRGRGDSGVRRDRWSAETRGVDKNHLVHFHLATARNDPGRSLHGRNSLDIPASFSRPGGQILSQGTVVFGRALQPGARRRGRAKDDGHYRRRARRRRSQPGSHKAYPTVGRLELSCGDGAGDAGRRLANRPHDGVAHHEAQARGRVRCRDGGRSDALLAIRGGIPVSTTHTITGAIIGVGRRGGSPPFAGEWRGEWSGPG